MNVPNYANRHFANHLPNSGKIMLITQIFIGEDNSVTTDSRRLPGSTNITAPADSFCEILTGNKKSGDKTKRKKQRACGQHQFNQGCNPVIKTVGFIGHHRDQAAEKHKAPDTAQRHP